MTPSEIRPLLSIEETCSVLGLRKTSIYEMMQKGDLPFVPVTDRKRMILPSDLEDFIAARRTGGWNRR